MSGQARPTRSHARSKVVLASSSSQDGLSNAAPVISRAEAAAITSATQGARSQPAFLGLDPLRAEPDEVFQKLHVKDAEEFERSVRDAYSESQAALRSLVSEQYPEMLGTASTVVDMAAASESLLVHVRRMRDTALSKQPLHADAALPSEKDLAADAAVKEMCGLAAASTLVDELPARARDLLARARPLTLHAAWSCTMARTAWGYVSERAEALTGLQAGALFPSLAHRRDELAALRADAVRRAHAQLATADLSYRAMLSHSLALVLLDDAKPGAALQLVLDRRKAAIERAARPLDGASAVDGCCEAIAQLLALHGTAVAHCANAFVLPAEGRTEPDFGDILSHMSRAEQDASTPLHARLCAETVISSIDSHPHLMRFLPDEVKKYTPYFELGEHADGPGKALAQLAAWSKAALGACWEGDGLQTGFAGLATVADLSAVAAAIHASIAESSGRLAQQLHAGERATAILQSVDADLGAFRSAAQRLLDERLVGLYRERLDEIARSFAQECRRAAQEEPARMSHWLIAAPGGSLADRLCGRTPLVDGVLRATEQQAADVAAQMQRFWDAPQSQQQVAHQASLRKQFAASVGALIDSLVGALSGAGTASGALVLAQVAATLAASEPLLQLAQAAQLGEPQARFREVAAGSLQPWVAAQATDAAALLAGGDSDMVDALYALAAALRQAGPALYALDLRERLLCAFAEAALARGELAGADAALLAHALPASAEAALRERVAAAAKGAAPDTAALRSLLLEPLLPLPADQPLPEPAPLVAEPSVRVFRKIAV